MYGSYALASEFELSYPPALNEINALHDIFRNDLKKTKSNRALPCHISPTQGPHRMGVEMSACNRAYFLNDISTPTRRGPRIAEIHHLPA